MVWRRVCNLENVTRVDCTHGVTSSMRIVPSAAGGTGEVVIAARVAAQGESHKGGALG